jgi:hypothetical protein
MSFEKMFAINVNDKTEKKNNLTYLSWAWAWSEFVKVYPTATYTIQKNADNMPYFKDDGGAFCYTTVTADGLTHEMWLPVMDYKNQAIKNPNAFEVNKTIMRCLTKNLAMFGLGLYIYAGEDLPEEDQAQKNLEKAKVEKAKLDELYKLIKDTGTDEAKFLDFFKAPSMSEVPYEKAKSMLLKKVAK